MARNTPYEKTFDAIVKANRARLNQRGCGMSIIVSIPPGSIPGVAYNMGKKPHTIAQRLTVDVLLARTENRGGRALYLRVPLSRITSNDYISDAYPPSNIEPFVDERGQLCEVPVDRTYTRCAAGLLEPRAEDWPWEVNKIRVKIRAKDFESPHLKSTTRSIMWSRLIAKRTRAVVRYQDNLGLYDLWVPFF